MRGCSGRNHGQVQAMDLQHSFKQRHLLRVSSGATGIASAWLMCLPAYGHRAVDDRKYHCREDNQKYAQGHQRQEKHELERLPAVMQRLLSDCLVVSCRV